MAPSNTRMLYASFSFLQMKYILFVAGNTVINGDIKMCQATENKIRLCHLSRNRFLHSSLGKAKGEWLAESNTIRVENFCPTRQVGQKILSSAFKQIWDS